MPGSNTKANLVKLLTKVPTDTDAKWRESGVVLPIGTPGYNTTTRELKIGMGTNFHNTLNHLHPGQYSPVGHEHMGGFNEKWFTTMPRLIHENALTLYPELVALSGQYVNGDIAAALADIYSGITQISPVINAGVHPEVNITGSSELAEFPAWNVFGSVLTIENAHWVSDQWITEAGTTACSITIEFIGAPLYKFQGYDIVTRLGSASAPYLQSPSPKDWLVQGSLDGTTWFDIEAFTDEPIWQPGEGREYENPSVVEIKWIRFNFTEWHPGADVNLTPGLKRIFLYGQRTDGFAMPNIPAPEGFVFAVPYKDLGIGMKHEEIGDIVYMTSDVKVTPINRVPVDGRVLKKTLEPDLFSVIQHNHDTQSNLLGVTCSTPAPHAISIVNGIISWNSDSVDTEAVVEYFEIENITEIIGMYSLIPKPDGAKPTHWLFEGYDGTTWHTLHDRTFNPNTEQYGIFKLQVSPEDLNIVKYRVSIITWSGTGTVGLSELKLYTHPKGYYYIPTMIFSSTDQVIPYIVTRVRTEDINASIVLRMQNSLAHLLELNAVLEQRVTTLEIQLAQNP